jgi:hypothetical protein
MAKTEGSPQTTAAKHGNGVDCHYIVADIYQGSVGSALLARTLANTPSNEGNIRGSSR